LALAEVALMGGRLVVTVPVGSAAAVREAAVAWYRPHAAVRLPERAAVCEAENRPVSGTLSAWR
jgi:hypothetical protein